MDPGEYIVCTSKKEAMDFMAERIKGNPGLKRYRFILERKYLNGDDIVKEDLDAICPDAELLILEGEGHSVWVNSKILERHGITDETPDRVPELSYYVRKNGHVTGNAFESSGWHMLFDDLNVTDEQIDAELMRWIDYSVKAGVTVVFDAGYPEGDALHERVYERLYELDKQGKLPVYIDGSIALTNQRKGEIFFFEKNICGGVPWLFPFLVMMKQVKFYCHRNTSTSPPTPLQKARGEL